MNNIEIVTAWNSTQNTNSVTDIKKLNKRSITHNNSKEKNDPSRKRVSRNSKKKRPKKKKKKITSKQNESPILDITNDDSFSTPKNVPKNPYRKFLLYKLRKKYDAKAYIYDLKKVNELIFNIPSHFTATFKEYLLKEEEAEFLKRIYLKNELNKKLRNVFYFYEKYSKIFPNYIVIPEGHYLYKNILKKQKMIDKLQKLKEEEKKNKQQILDLSFNTVFTNGAIDSIYSNNADPLNSINLSNIVSMDNIGKNEEQEVPLIINLIKNIEKYENVVDIKNMESLAKKQIIYKKEFRGLRSLSKSSNFQTVKERKRKSKEYQKKNKLINNDDEKYLTAIKTVSRKKKNNIYNINKKKIISNNNTEPSTKREEGKRSIGSESEENHEKSYEENQNDSVNIKFSRTKNDNNNRQSSRELYDEKDIRSKYKKIKRNKRLEENEKESANGEDEEEAKNKKKKFIVFRGRKHYFIKNADLDDKSLENAITNDDKNSTYVSKNNIENESTLYYSKIKEYKNNNSFSQKKNKSKEHSIRNSNNFILYKKKLCHGNRGLSISKKNFEFDNNMNNSKRLYRINTNFTANCSKIIPQRKYHIKDQKTITIKNPGNTDVNQEKWRKIMNNNIFLDQKTYDSHNSTCYKGFNTIHNNLDNEHNKNCDSINRNIYYRKYKNNDLCSSHGDKSCPKNYNKFLLDLKLNKKKDYISHNDSIEDRSNRSNDQSNAEGEISNHRYYRTNLHNNNKKFKLRAPKNYYKIDLV